MKIDKNPVKSVYFNSVSQPCPSLLQGQGGLKGALTFLIQSDLIIHSLVNNPAGGQKILIGAAVHSADNLDKKETGNRQGNHKNPC